MTTAESAPRPTVPHDGFVPERLVLLHADPGDAVARVLNERGRELGVELIALSAAELLDEVAFDTDGWTWRGRRIDPANTAVVNRLPLADRLGAHAGQVSRIASARLRHELERFGYASSLPTATSVIGCRGSLLDQWIDVPQLLPELALRVPAHSTPARPRTFAEGAAVCSVDRWALYSLGEPRSGATVIPPGSRLDYARPPGRLVTLAQVGGSMFFADPPPEMTQAKADAIVAFARGLARVSPLRIMEHVFFLGDATPVFYSTCPVPVISGSHALYPELVLQGLRDDIRKWGRAARR